MKLRLSIILPAVVLMIVLAVLAYALPTAARALTIALPIVGVGALGTVFLIERRRRRKTK